jgi:dCTP diphosphatase
MNASGFHIPILIFYGLQNLSAALSVEVAELLECFQWAKDNELEELVVRERMAIED